MTSEDGRSHHERIFAECSALMMDLVRLPTPVIAAVDGVRNTLSKIWYYQRINVLIVLAVFYPLQIAAAAGCQLVAVCDMAVATQRSSFSTPGSNFGIFCSTPGVPLARAVPR